VPPRVLRTRPIIPSGLRRLLCAVPLGLGGTAAAQSTPPAGAARDTAPALAVRLDTLLDLPTIVVRALRANPASVQGAAGVRIATSGRRVADGAFLPNLTATSAAVRSDVTSAGATPSAGAASSYSAGLASSVDLFTGGRRGADRDRAGADLAAAEALDLSQRFAVTLLAERAYFDALRGADLIGVAAARVARAQQGVRFAHDRVGAGTATRSDELRAGLELTAGRQQLLGARDTLQAAAYALGRLVGAEGPVGAQRPPSLDVRLLALDDSAIVRLAVEQAPLVRATTAQAQASEAAIRAARAQYLPDVRLTGGYNVANQSSVIGGARPGWQVAVGTSFPLFNGYQREDAVVRADAGAALSRSIAEDARRQARAESARLLSALRFAAENIGLAEDAVGAAREDLRVQTQRYRAGISTALDQLTSELALTQAELGVVAARYAYQVTRAALEALVGRTL
jgi:outer membrane protein